MFLDGAKLHRPGRILLPVSSSRTGCPIARSAEELSSTWPSPADITVDLDHRPNWTERIVALRLRPTVGDLRLCAKHCTCAIRRQRSMYGRGRPAADRDPGVRVPSRAELSRCSDGSDAGRSRSWTLIAGCRWRHRVTQRCRSLVNALSVWCRRYLRIGPCSPVAKNPGRA